MSSASNKENMVLGKITAVYGIKGWVKIYSFTDPMENIFEYQPWRLNVGGTLKEVKVEASKKHGKGLIAKLDGVDDRNIAQTYCGYEILADSGLLPELKEGEYYWSQLQNLLVYTESNICKMLSIGYNKPAKKDVIAITEDEKRKFFFPILCKIFYKLFRVIE